MLSPLGQQVLITLARDVASTSENFYQTMQHSNPEDSHLHDTPGFSIYHSKFPVEL
jgi:hypothetical protein